MSLIKTDTNRLRRDLDDWFTSNGLREITNFATPPSFATNREEAMVLNLIFQGSLCSALCCRHFETNDDDAVQSLRNGFGAILKRHGCKFEIMNEANGYAFVRIYRPVTHNSGHD